MVYLKNLAEISKKNILFSGGKAANLGWLIKTGFNVPSGFVVGSPAFDLFLKQDNTGQKIKKLLKEINSKKIYDLIEKSKKIQKIILDLSIPDEIAKEVNGALIRWKNKKFAVRSSAISEDSKNHSWAGMLESYVDVPKNKIVGNIKKCWASYFSPRANMYRLQNKIDVDDILCAVIVQEMLKPETAGVCFTANPANGNQKELFIEAAHGVADKVVGGKTIPDSYVIDKISNKTISKKINGKKSIIDNKQIEEIADICGLIEKKAGAPQDIEWAFARRKFFILQTRPITTLTK